MKTADESDARALAAALELYPSADVAIDEWRRGVAIPESAIPVLIAEIERLRAAIEQVRALCDDVMVEDVKGGLTNADSLWPSDVLAALGGARG